MENFDDFFPLLKTFLGEVYGSPERGLAIYQSKYRAVDYYRNYRSRPGSYLLILKEGGRPCGFLYGRRLKDCSYIYDIFVEPRLRGRGLGKALVRAFAALTPSPYRADVHHGALESFKRWGFKELSSYLEDGVRWHLVEASTL